MIPRGTVQLISCCYYHCRLTATLVLGYAIIFSPYTCMPPLFLLGLFVHLPVLLPVFSASSWGGASFLQLPIFISGFHVVSFQVIRFCFHPEFRLECFNWIKFLIFCLVFSFVCAFVQYRVARISC